MPAYASATHKFGFEAAAPSSSSPGRDPPLPRGLRALRSPRPGERACFLSWGPPAGRFGVSVTLSSDGERGCVPGGCKWLFAMPSTGKFVPGAAFSPRKRSICGGQVLYTDLKFTGGGCPSGSQAILVRSAAPKLGEGMVAAAETALKGPSASQPAMGRFPLLATARLWPRKALGNCTEAVASQRKGFNCRSAWENVPACDNPLFTRRKGAGHPVCNPVQDRSRDWRQSWASLHKF